MSKIKFKTVLIEYLPYIILTLILILVHYPIHIINGDDVAYAKQMSAGAGLFNTLYARYFTWSSRLIVEFVMYLVVQNEIVWKAVNIAMYLLLMYSLDRLIDCESRIAKRCLIAALLLVFPITEMNSAGWVATTTGYFWTISMGAFALISVKKALDGEKLTVCDYILSALSILYAANHEQMAVVLIIVYSALLIYSLIVKRFSNIFLVHWCIAVIEMIVILLAPGNAARQLIVRTEACPDYFLKSPVRLFYESYANVMNYLIFDKGICFILLLLICAIGLWIRYKEWYIRLGGLLPVIYVVWAHINKFPSSIEFLFRHLVVIGIDEVNSKRVFIAVVISAVILGWVIAELNLLIDDRFTFATMVVLLGSGLLCKIALGTTGSAFTAAYRSISFLNVALLITVAVVCGQIMKWTKRNRVIYVIAAVACYQTIISVSQLVIHGGVL